MGTEQFNHSLLLKIDGRYFLTNLGWRPRVPNRLSRMGHSLLFLPSLELIAQLNLCAR